MAKKPTESAPADPKPAIIAAALTLAADKSWSEITLPEIAAAAGLSLAQLYRAFPSKPAILIGLSRGADEAALAIAADPEESVRDRLFDLLMRRFEALAPHRPGLRRIGEETRKLRPHALPAALLLPRSMAWMLEAAGVPASGLRGVARAQLLTFAYASSFGTFLEDDSADLARTMAALDRALRRIEPLMGLPSGPASDAPAR